MASSRLERLGSIYSRTTGLIKAGAMKPSEKPLWYDIYEAFPPEKEPRVDQPILKTEIRPIFYAEDQIRAKFHKQQGNSLRIVKLHDSINPSDCQQLIAAYNKLKIDKQEESEERLFADALDILNAQKSLYKRNSEEESPATDSIVSSFKEAKRSDGGVINIDMKNIFKDQ